MIPTFNSANFAREAIRSVVSQAPGAEEMEIVVVDDASTDNIAGVVAGFGERVRLYRQESNLGVPRNLTECIRLSRGEIVHILHGDDLVCPGFYSAMDSAFSDPDTGAAFCRQIFIDGKGTQAGMSPVEQADGLIANAAVFLAQEQRVMTPSICVRRSVYEAVGGFHPQLACAEDWEMWVRIAARFPVAYVGAPLAMYRMHEESNTGRHARHAAEIPFTLHAIALMSRHLPEEVADRTAARARRTYARSALSTARRMARAGNRPAALAQVRGAIQLNPSLRTLAAAFVTVMRMAAHPATDESHR